MPPPDLVSLFVLLPPWWGEYELLWVLCILSPSVFTYYSEYILRGALLNSNIVWKAALSDYMVLSFISSLTIAQDEPTGKRHHYVRVPDDVQFEVKNPLPSRIVKAITNFSFFHVVRSTSSDTALAYVTFRRTAKSTIVRCSV